MTSDAAITYAKADLKKLELSAASFDLAYSSLVFHYVEDFAGLLSKVHQFLIPGGRLIFSIEHPILMAPTHQEWLVGADGRNIGPSMAIWSRAAARRIGLQKRQQVPSHHRNQSSSRGPVKHPLPFS
jgi:ubiquinone/menaquinone biosynthesis C-methylase UbiE